MMNTPAQSVQIKVTMPAQMADFLASKAQTFGMTVSAYLRHLALKEVEKMDIPEFEASDRAIRNYHQSLEDEKNNALVKVTSVKKFFKNL